MHFLLPVNINFANYRLVMCYLVILSVELCLGKLWEISSSHAQNYFNCRKNTRVLGIPITPIPHCIYLPKSWT